MAAAWKITSQDCLLVAKDCADIESLLSADAVRKRCHVIGALSENGQGHWFNIKMANFQRCVDLVGETCTQNYPDLNIPLHSRWRHFEINGQNLWRIYTENFQGDALELSRSAIDLVFVSVLVDAGAGAQWQYKDPITGSRLNRSEGLAAASIDLFFNHLADNSGQGWEINGKDLQRLTLSRLRKVFQNSGDNPLLGLEGRLELLQGLGQVLEQQQIGRPGKLLDQCLDCWGNSMTVDITDVLTLVLKQFNAMWPNGYQHGKNNLGDCGYHSALEGDQETSGIVPFHKLSQWLTYSLIEPLQWAGFEVVNLDGLTGLPEYRNGGLFIDTGVIQPLDVGLLQSTLAIHSEAVVEWRAITVYLLDQVAGALRKSLGLDAQQLPLGSVLQGGTWMAGRQLAGKLRDDASPPLNLAIDGTIF